MSIAGAGQTIVDLLQARLTETGSIGDYQVALMAPREIVRDLENRIALILYRVEADQTRRHVDLPRRAPNWQPRQALGLELRYLLAIWGRASAAGEHVMLGNCMQILEENAVVSGPLLSTAYTWEPRAALKVTIDLMTTHDLLRLWDSIDAAYQLSVPYLMRTVTLPATEPVEAPMVDARTLVYVPGVPE